MAVKQERIEVRPTGPHTNKLQLMKNMVALPALLSVYNCKATLLWGTYTVNIYRNKTIEANGNTGVISTTSKSFSLYREFL